RQRATDASRLARRKRRQTRAPPARLQRQPRRVHLRHPTRRHALLTRTRLDRRVNARRTSRAAVRPDGLTLPRALRRLLLGRRAPRLSLGHRLRRHNLLPHRLRRAGSKDARHREHASIYTEAGIRQLVNISHKSGHLEEEERQLINRVFDFSDAEVREAMIPRTEVQALPITATLEDCEEAFCDYGYSRLPVYRERLDDIAGVLFMKDLMPCLRTVNPVPFDMARM